MTPAEFYQSVALPNVQKALADPGDICLAANAILTLDALIGIVFWHLKDKGHSTVAALKDDSEYKDAIADTYDEFRALRDAAFALKHGRLTGKKDRVIRDPQQITAGPNTLGWFELGDELGGGLVYMALTTKTERADNVIGPVSEMARRLVAGLPA